MSALTRVFCGRLAGKLVYGPDGGEPVGRIRDVVFGTRPGPLAPRVIGLEVQLRTRQRIFVPILRVATIDLHGVTLVTGSVSLTAFKSRAGETRAVAELMGQGVVVTDSEYTSLHGRACEVTDIEIERLRSRDWVVTRLAVRRQSRKTPFGRTYEPVVVPWAGVEGLNLADLDGSGAKAADSDLVVEINQMRPADAADAILDLELNHRATIAREFDDERLADVLQEMSEEDQAELISELSVERAADVLEAMDPDDAADLLEELDSNRADVLLELMDPEESAPVRRLMRFESTTVGGLMTPEPIIMRPHDNVAAALARCRNPDLAPSLASLVFVVRPPSITPTGQYLGCVHIQKLLREPPSMAIGHLVDDTLPVLHPQDDHETAARYFARYNLVCGAVLDDQHHLLGAVAVDDLLDHLLPENWRDEDD